MFPFRLLSALKNRRECHAGQPATKARRTRLTLESLEDRCLMSAGVIDPPTPIGPTTAFAVGIGPGMQIDFFETDRAGQVFAQPALNLLANMGVGGIPKGPTVFISPQVQISNLIPPQDGGLPPITIQGQNGQLFPGLLTNPSDPHVFGAAVNSLLGPFAGFLGVGNGGSSQSGATSGIVGTWMGTVSASSWQLPGGADPASPYTITLTINADGSGQITISPDQAGFSTTFTGQITQNADGTLTLIANGPTGTTVELTEAQIVNGNQLNGNLDVVTAQGFSVSFDATDDTGAFRLLLNRQ